MNLLYIWVRTLLGRKVWKSFTLEVHSFCSKIDLYWKTSSRNALVFMANATHLTLISRAYHICFWESCLLHHCSTSQKIGIIQKIQEKSDSNVFPTLDVPIYALWAALLTRNDNLVHCQLFPMSVLCAVIFCTQQLNTRIYPRTWDVQGQPVRSVAHH